MTEQGVRGFAVFRADACRSLGSGHVMRCLTLAEALRAGGWQCAFACGAATSSTVPALHRAGFEMLDLDSESSLRQRWRGGCDLLVVDHYGLDARWEAEQRGWARRILVVDDLADRAHDCDLLLDQTLGRGDDYRALVPPSCRLLLGPEFALLRPQFAEARAAALPQRGGALRRVIIALGGTDPHDVTPRSLRGVVEGGLELDVDVVLGASAQNLEQVREQVARTPRATLHVDVDDMAELFARADLAIGAGGTMSWERCALGLPSLIVLLANNQRLVAERLQARGAARVLGWHSELDADAIARGIEALHPPETRAAMAEAAASVVDGLGARRVVEALG